MRSVIEVCEGKQGAILLVEDDAHDIEAMKIALRRAESPHQLIVVTDGREAIRYLSGLGDYGDRKRFPKPCLVLLDLSLPQVSGFEVLAWSQTQPSDRIPSIIVLSYSRLEHDRRLALQLGAKGYYVKSTDLDGTVALIKSLLVLNFLPTPTEIETSTTL